MTEKEPTPETILENVLTDDEIEEVATTLNIISSTLGDCAFDRNVDDAIASYKRAVTQKPDDLNSHNQLGYLYLRRGDLGKAEAQFNIILNHDKAAGGDASAKEWQAIAYGNLGAVHEARKELGGAVAMYQKALAINKELGRKEGMATAFTNLGNIYRIREDLDAAQAMFKKAIKINEEIGDIEGLANNYNGLGTIHDVRNELDDAEAMYQKSLVINVELGSKEGIANAFANLGRILKARGDLDGAKEAWFAARAVFEDYGMSHKVQKMDDWLAELASRP